jgi:hypothetical protein
MGSRQRPRWGTGPAPTHRDVATLAWVADQYAVRADTLGLLLGRHSPEQPRTVHRLAEPCQLVGEHTAAVGMPDRHLSGRRGRRVGGGAGGSSRARRAAGTSGSGAWSRPRSQR